MYQLLFIGSKETSRERIEMLLRGCQGICLIGRARTVNEIRNIEVPAPDIVMIDVEAEPWRYAGDLVYLRQRWTGAHVLLAIGDWPNPSQSSLVIFEAADGSRDVIRGSEVIDMLLHLSEAYAVNSRCLTKAVNNHDHSALRNLTLQEYRVLRLLSLGFTNKEIARELKVKVSTVKSYLKVIYGKLGVSNRVEATLVWLGRDPAQRPERVGLKNGRS